MHSPENDPRDNSVKWRDHIKLRQQRMVRFVENVVSAAAPASIIGPEIGLNVIPTSCVLREHTTWRLASSDKLESATISLDEDNIL